MQEKSLSDELQGELDYTLYKWVRAGVQQRRKLGGRLRLAFKPGLLTATRIGMVPSPTEITTLINSLRRAIKAATFSSKLPAVQKSDLLHWPEVDAMGYRLTWEQNNETHNKKN